MLGRLLGRLLQFLQGCYNFLSLDDGTSPPPFPREAMLNCLLCRSPTFKAFNPLRNLSTDSCGLTPPPLFCNVESVCPKRRQIKHVTAIRINFAHWGKGRRRGLYLSFAGGGIARPCLGRWFSCRKGINGVRAHRKSLQKILSWIPSLSDSDTLGINLKCF